MAIETHIESLKKKHGRLEDDLAEAMASPATDDVTLATIKRRKLRLKDQIARLERPTSH